MKLNFKQGPRIVSRFITEQSPQILTVIAVAGVGATAYFTTKATFEASKKIEDKMTMARIHGEIPEMTKNEKIQLIWKLYVTPAAVGVMTIGCIVAANRIQARRFAAVVAAYGVLSGDFDEFRDKASEKLGLKKADEVNQEIAKGRIENANLPPNALLTDGKSWFYDKASDRTLPSTMETIKSGMNKVNFQCRSQRDATLNDFYRTIGWPTTGVGDIVGWNEDKMCDIDFQAVLSETHGAVTSFDFISGPFPN